MRSSTNLKVFSTSSFKRYSNISMIKTYKDKLLSLSKPHTILMAIKDFLHIWKVKSFFIKICMTISWKRNIAPLILIPSIISLNYRIFSYLGNFSDMKRLKRDVCSKTQRISIKKSLKEKRCTTKPYWSISTLQFHRYPTWSTSWID